jgi:hypothetical protein
MTAKKPDQARNASGATQPAADAGVPPLPKALPKESEHPETDPFRAGRGCVDVMGIMPEGIRIDPDITEGHPGYEESGDSELIPTERLTRGASEDSQSAG